MAGDLEADWLTDLKVSDMDDGGMGSLRLAPSGIDSRGRRYGRTAAELEFEDVDGVKVLVSLNLDEVGAPFELAIWTVDFSPLMRLPGGSE